MDEENIDEKNLQKWINKLRDDALGPEDLENESKPIPSDDAATYEKYNKIKSSYNPLDPWKFPTKKEERKEERKEEGKEEEKEEGNGLLPEKVTEEMIKGLIKRLKDQDGKLPSNKDEFIKAITKMVKEEKGNAVGNGKNEGEEPEI